MQRLRKSLWLPLKEKLLFSFSFAVLGMARLAVLTVPFRHLAMFLGEKMTDSSPATDQRTQRKAAKIGQAIEKMSRYTPWESKCLVKALAAVMIFRLFRMPYTLYLGLDKDESDKLIAHAWLRCGELTVTGNKEKDRFKVVAKFSKQER